MAAWPVLVLLGFHFFCPVVCSVSTVKVTDGGYDDIEIAIHPAVPENDIIIEKIQQMIKEATHDLFYATNQRLFIRSIKILIPSGWSQKATYGYRTREKYETAHVIIANTFLNIGDSPYTRQYGGCGEQGQFIHLTPNFLMNEDLISVYGAHGKLFVQQWARLRWGVFEEYNTDQPFYISPNLQVEATRCSVNISGIYRVPEHVEDSCLTKSCNIDPHTGLYEQKCTFFPEKNQTAGESIMYFPGLQYISEFCTENSHNMEAPTMQNRMCDCHSTWDIIRNSSDIYLSSPKEYFSPPEPVFSFLSYRERVITLLIDVSGSMATNNRLWRVHQAVDIFLTEAIAPGTYVGLVEFSLFPFTLAELKQINSDADREQLKSRFPNTASNYGSDFCIAIQKAFQVNEKLYGSSDGTEIIFLADGYDLYVTSKCFNVIKTSGAIIHTIALSSSAAKELEDIADMTGGLKYFATDSLQSNDLIHAFIGISNENVDFTQRVSQLESNSPNVNPSDCSAGTVLIDSTMGWETFFTVTWQSAAPDVQLTDPAGTLYSTDKFIIRDTSHLSRLKIPDSARTGVWSYTLCNNYKSSQTLGLVVTSKAANANVPPISVDVHMNEDTNYYPTTMIVYASVSQGLLPVKGAKVTAIITSEKGNLTTLELLDNGAGADIAKDDGIYSKYFFTFPVSGRYNVEVRVEGEDGKCRLTHPRGRAFYLRGFVENGKVVMKPPDPLGDEVLPALGGFKLAITGGSCMVSAEVDASDDYPPGKIIDLEAQVKGGKVILSWTATGDDLDQGTAQSYELRMNKNIKDLRDNFEGSIMLDISSITPSPAGTREEFQFNPVLHTEDGTVLYFALIAVDTNLQKSATSNIAQAAFLSPTKPRSTALPVTKCSTPKPNTCTTVKFIQDCNPTTTPKQPITCPPKPSPKCPTSEQTTD